MRLRSYRFIILLLLSIITAMSVFGKDNVKVRNISYDPNPSIIRPESGTRGIIQAGDNEISDLPSQNEIPNSNSEFSGNGIAWANATSQIILDSQEWKVLEDMDLEFTSQELSENERNIIMVNFSCTVSDRVPDFYGGVVRFRLTRDGEELTRRQLCFANSEYYQDKTAALCFTDDVDSGVHTYKIEYKLPHEGYKLLVGDRNMQILGSKK